MLALSLWLLLTPQDPIYRGKRLSVWLQEVPQPSAFQDGFNDLIQEESSVVLPHLVRTLRTSDSPFRPPYIWVATHAPTIIASHMPQWSDPPTLRTCAANWLTAMGPSAKEAAPSLRYAAAHDRSELVRQAAIYALVRIGPEQQTGAVLVEDLHHPSSKVREAAAGALEILTPDAPDVIPALITGLKDKDPVVRQVCAATLARYGRRAEPAVTQLRKLAASDDMAADYALRALQQIVLEGSETGTQFFQGAVVDSWW